MKIGYARVSTEEQCLDLQLSALKAAGCDTILSDHGVSGSRFDRPGLHEALRIAQVGDTLLVWRLDRLGRSLRHLLEAVNSLGQRGVEFASLTERIDTRSSTGMLMFHMIAALAEFERSLISERTRAGMAAARARGAKIGRPKVTRMPDETEDQAPRVVASPLKTLPAFGWDGSWPCPHGFHLCDLLRCRACPCYCDGHVLNTESCVSGTTRGSRRFCRGKVVW
ncbi:recombinase family protein [Burkholderia ubonensis]|uniref:recombinase family protein n=1 Tax=Burkholderia ubonensis TaxID=101571 RepID=UPI0009B40F96|nr:recombinase family protein [Burkholderia ubonensis]